MLSLKSYMHGNIIEAFINTSRYQDGVYNIDNPVFNTITKIIVSKLNRRVKYIGTILDWGLSISNGIISS